MCNKFNIYYFLSASGNKVGEHLFSDQLNEMGRR